MSFFEECRVHSILVPHQVPLVCRDDESGTGLDRVSGDVAVLRAGALRSVDDEQADVAALQRAQRSQQAVSLDVLGDDAAPANARSIHEADLPAVERDHRVDDVARRPRNRRDQRALRARPSPLSNEDFPVFGRPMIATLTSPADGSVPAAPFSGSSATKRSSRSPVSVPCSAEMRSGSPSPSRYSSSARYRSTWLSALLPTRMHRASTATQRLRDLLVERGHAVTHVDHEAADVRLGDRHLRLLARCACERRDIRRGVASATARRAPPCPRS